MKTRILSFILLFSMLSTGLIAQDFRIKKITKKVYGPNEADTERHTTTFNYESDQLISYQESGDYQTNYTVRYDKNKIFIIPNGKEKEKDEIRLDKNGRVERNRNISFKYDKSGVMTFYKQVDPYKQWTREKDLIYDETGRLKVIGSKKGNIDSGRLIFHDQAGNPIRVLDGTYYGPKREGYNESDDIRATWKDGKIQELQWVRYDGTVWKKHIFEYNEAGLLIGEKIYDETNEKEVVLFREYIIEYEAGKGNADMIYSDYSNIELNIPFGVRTYDYEIYTYY